MYIQSIGCIYKRIGVYSSFHKAFLLCMWYGIYMGYMDIRDDCFLNITVQMYPCSEGTDTGSPAL